MRINDSNLMPLAASVVVGLYAAGVFARRGGLWYEWLAALLGVAAMAAYWIWDFRRARRRASKGK